MNLTLRKPVAADAPASASSFLKPSLPSRTGTTSRAISQHGDGGGVHAVVVHAP